MTDPADLHLHTNRSDGAHPAAAVARLAAEAGLAAFAITDHDTVAAIPEAQAEAALLGIELIPGVEIGVEHDGVDVHLLAYHVDPADPGLLRLLAGLRRGREERLRGMLRRLHRLGLPLAAAEVRRLAPRGGPVGRPHLAEALVRRRWVASVDEAFRHLIGTEGPAYLPNRTPEPEAVLRTILEAGGIPVLAHPAVYRYEGFLDRFAAAGLLGLEVHHPRHDPVTTRRLRALAAERGFLETGGSDYHGGLPRELPVGSVRPPGGALARLAEARAQVPETLRRSHGAG